MTRLRRPWRVPLAALLALPLAWAIASAARPEAPVPPAAQPGGWVDVDYADIVDRRRLTHSGETVGSILARRGTDAVSLSLLDPILEPYGFVLSDALDTLRGASKRPLVEVGALWQPGERQPAWAELLRSRSILVESDGAGRMRVCAPSTGTGAGAAADAYERAWPVLRLVFEAERRRLARKSGDRPEDHPLDVELHPFVHEAVLTLFRLGVDSHRVRVTDTRPRGGRPPVDFDALDAFLHRGALLEGGRIEGDGALRLLGSDASKKPEVLGHEVALSDWAVAYRAVFHGGLAEPYMSLDRGSSPQTSIVNYGGRLRDTSLGLVSLLCDIRFKTFSLGIDVVSDKDVREEVRAKIPGFRTHLERFAADPGTRGVTGQQTRLWFYPDDVDLTVSKQGDVLVLRRARLTASSERVSEGVAGSRPADPPWTQGTVAAINRDYAKLGAFFPELDDLDQVARLLSLFAWLRQAQTEGLAVPELDALLAVELPPISTPRRFPQLLAFNALPPSGTMGPADVISQIPVGEGLDRLDSTLRVPVTAARRLDRALRALDPALADHAAVVREIESVDRARLDDASLDLLAYRAERLRMHRLVLSTLRQADRDRLAHREKELRVFSVGIGGLDLGMSKRLAIAPRRSERISWGAAGRSDAPAAPSVAISDGARGGTPSEEWRRDSARLPKTEVPDHGVTGAASGASRIEAGAGTWKGGSVSFTRTVFGANGPDPSSRGLWVDGEGRVQFVERLEEGRTLRFRLEKDGTALRARTVDAGVVPAEAVKPVSPAPPPAGLALLEVLGGPPPAARASEAEPPTVGLRVRRAGTADSSASFPRPILQRLLLGRDADLSPADPLQGWIPSGTILGDASGLMVLLDDAWTTAPWKRASPAVPGEEDPLRLAAAIRTWWRSEPGSPPVVVGVDASASPPRWEKAPKPNGSAVLLLPNDAFPGPAAIGRDAVAAAWKASAPAAALPAIPGPALVILVSAEPPGVLGDRVRGMARDPALAGRLLAVCSLAGPLRPDLPASLLADGKLAGFGVAEAPAAGVGRVLRSLEELSESIASTKLRDRRVEALGGPFLWYF